MGYSPWGGKESDTTEWLTHTCPIVGYAGEDVEKREPFCTVGGNVNWYSHYGEQYGYSSMHISWMPWLINDCHAKAFIWCIIRDNTSKNLWVLIWVPLPSQQKGLQNWLKVRKTESYIPIPSRDVSFYVFFFFFSFCLSFILSHTCFRPSWESVVEVQGVSPIREDLGFILCLYSPLVIWIQFALGSMLQGKEVCFFFLEQWKKPIRNVKS